MKQLEANPWDIVEYKYPVGSTIEGKVRHITDFGIFVGVEEGIDGLVHISDISWGQRVKHPSDRFKKGQVVQARVLNIDKGAERFSLGIKQLTSDPWLNIDRRYFLGQAVQGSVVHVAEFGVFVEIEDGVEGLIHTSELKQGKASDLAAAYPVGEKITAEIIAIDPHDRKMGLSEKAVERRGEGESSASGQSSQATLGDIMSRELFSKSSSGDRSEG
jgi:small subunit ribosomal protein S1